MLHKTLFLLLKQYQTNLVVVVRLHLFFHQVT